MTISSNPSTSNRRFTVYPPRALQSALKKIRLSLGRDPSAAVIDRALDALDIVRAKAEHIASLEGMYPDWTRLDAIAENDSSQTHHHLAQLEHLEYPAGTTKFIREVLKSASGLLGTGLRSEEMFTLEAQILSCAITTIKRLAQLASEQAGTFTAADLEAVVGEVPNPRVVDYALVLFLQSYYPHTKNP